CADRDAVAGGHARRLLAAEVEDVDDALGGRDARRHAQILGQPLRASDRRRREAALGAELALRLAPEAAHDLRLRAARAAPVLAAPVRPRAARAHTVVAGRQLKRRHWLLAGRLGDAERA